MSPRQRKTQRHSIILIFPATEIRVFHVIVATKKWEEGYPETRGGSPLAAWAHSDGLGPAGRNTGQRQEGPGRKAPVLWCILPELEGKNTKLQSH